MIGNRNNEKISALGSRSIPRSPLLYEEPCSSQATINSVGKRIFPV